MREFSHRTGITIGGVVLALTAGGFAFTPAAGSPATARHQVTAAPRGGGAPWQDATRLAAVRFAGVRPSSPMEPRSRHRAAVPAFTRNTSNVESTNWGGYAGIDGQHPFRYVQATFFVPYVNCATSPGSFSAHWAGLDGFDTATVEQAGVLAACQGSTPAYTAWYEMYPDIPVYPNITIKAGDSIVARVFWRAATNRFEISLADTTNGRHFSRVLACPSGSTCQRSSAEAISEPPSSSSAILPLTDFRAESFTGVRLTDQTGFRATLRSPRWQTVRVTTVSRSSSAVVDQPTQLFHGTTFDNYWMRTG